MKRLVVALAAVALAPAAVACSDPVAEAAEHLGDIRSGELHVAIEVGTVADAPATVSYSLDGPFALAHPGELPVADLTWVRTADDDTSEARFLSTGQEAFVVVDDQPYQLDEGQVAGLRAPAGEEGEGSNPLESLDVESWVQDPETTEEGDLVTVRGDLDVPVALNAILALTSQVGAREIAGIHPVEDEDADRLRRAVEEATFELVSTKEDHLLRSLAIDVRLAAPGEGPLAERPPVPAVSFSFELGIERPNEPVSVEAPEGALPISELEGVS
jgi:hypothetical protein